MVHVHSCTAGTAADADADADAPPVVMLARTAAALLCVSAHARMDDLIAEGNTNGYWIGIDVLASLFLGGQKPPPPAPTKVKVFVAGLPRTGTGSLTLALKELGYRPLWGEDLFDFADELESLYAGKLSKAELLDVIGAKGYNAAGLDLFGPLLYEDAADIPGVKLILTERPVGGAAGWADSVGTTVGLHYAWFQSRPFTWLSDFRKLGPWFRDTITYLTDGKPDEPSNRAALRAAHDKHQLAVKETYARLGKELLVYNVKSGWGPLCEFLEVEACPQTPFPRANDRDMMMAITWVFWVVVNCWPLLPLLPILLVTWLGIGLYRCFCGCGRRPATRDKFGGHIAKSKKRA